MRKTDEHKIFEKALFFLTNNLQKSGHNPKTVGIHSILVATRLYRHDFDNDVIAAALLHDTVEDTDVTIDDIRREFGDKIATLVAAVTFDKDDISYQEKQQLFEKNLQVTLRAGSGALAIRAADLVENSDFYNPEGSEELRQYLTHKFEHFMGIAEPYLAGSPLWLDVKHAYKKNVKTLNLVPH